MTLELALTPVIAGKILLIGWSILSGILNRDLSPLSLALLLLGVFLPTMQE